MTANSTMTPNSTMPWNSTMTLNSTMTPNSTTTENSTMPWNSTMIWISTMTWFSTMAPNPTTTPTATETDQEKFYRLIKVVVPPIFGLTAFIGGFGNILVILVVLLNKTMRNTLNIILLNLAVTDLIFLACCVPFTAMKFALEKWTTGIVMCKVVNYLRHAALYGSTYTLVLLVISRYLAMAHSVKASVICTPKNTYIAICVMWFFILSSSTYYLCTYSIFEGNYTYPENNVTMHYSICLDQYIVDDKPKNLAYILCYVLLGFALPLVFICVVYILMRRHIHDDHMPLDDDIKPMENMKTKKRAALMVGVVILLFVLCWLPNMALLFLAAIYPPIKISNMYYTFFIATKCLGYFNSCLNPIIYALLSPNYRRGFYNLLCCVNCRQGSQDSTSQTGKCSTESTELVAQEKCDM